MKFQTWTGRIKYTLSLLKVGGLLLLVGSLLIGILGFGIAVGILQFLALLKYVSE